MAKNQSLLRASIEKNDEFYTRIEDINNELHHYEKHFKDKTIFCNCDDPTFSNFFKYFQLNFYRLGLKKLICTHYKYEGTSYKLEIERDITKEGQIGFIPKETQSPLKENGDFRNEECIKLLEEADIVVTNPPFSLFREYVSQLIEYNKKFIIIGSINACNNKEFFPLIKDNKIWIGYGFQKGNAYFKVPEDAINNYAKGVYDEKTGLVHFRNVTWYTNIDIEKRHEKVLLWKQYKKENYPKYYNLDGIDVDKIQNIPCDYYGYMGVPITFLECYNPEQFELIGLGSYVEKKYVHTVTENKTTIQYIDKETNEVKWTFPYSISERKIGNSLRIEKDGKPANCPYSRVIIKRRKDD